MSIADTEAPMRTKSETVMNDPSGTLSSTERTTSALLGLALTFLAMRRGATWARGALGVAGASLMARGLAGHCAVKAAVGRSRAKAVKSAAVDESVDQSFPASDPPASRLPDEPPSNAEAKWEAARRRPSPDQEPPF